MNYIHKIFLGTFLIICLFIVWIFPVAANDALYGSVDKVKYLMGDYQRSGNLKTFTNKKEKNSHSLREDTIEALNKMISAYEIDREKEGKTKQHIFIVSGHRSYSDQKSIWEQKYKGNRKMRESVVGKTPEQIINLILEYSSAPGTSRHHWGTDFDMNALQNDYFSESGKGAYLYEWMQANASKFGFCQPYNEHNKRGNKGYKEEKWHWSYARVANRLQQDWEASFKKKEIVFAGKFLGSELLGERPLEYVTAINHECKEIK